MSLIYDLLIIGAGPGGISLAVEAEKVGIHPDKLLIIEKSPEHSWTIRTLYHDSKKVTPNYKGLEPQCRGVMCLNHTLSKENYLSFVDQTIQTLHTPIHYNEEVQKIESMESQNSPLFLVHTTVQTYQSKLVGIATGVFSRPKKPDYTIPAIIKKRIHFDVGQLSSLKDPQRIMIVGGGDTASEFVQYFVEKGHQVSLSYRQGSFFRMNDINHASLLKLAELKKVNILYEHDISELESGTSNAVKVHFKNGKSSVTVDHIVYALGGSTPRAFLEAMGIQFEENTPLHFDGGETNVPGLFITGDLRMGLKGGSILTAYNSSNESISKICDKYLNCRIGTTA